MTAKLSWEVQKTSLVLTVTDGPRTSHYRLSKTASAEAHSAILRDVLLGLGTEVPQVAVRPSVGPRVAVQGVSGVGQVDAVAQLAAEIDAPLPMSEEESLELLKRRAYELAVRGAKFTDGEIDAVLTGRLLNSPPHTAFGQNPGLPELGAPGYQTVDGRQMSVEDIREKPRFNVENHED